AGADRGPRLPGRFGLHRVRQPRRDAPDSRHRHGHATDPGAVAHRHGHHDLDRLGRCIPGHRRDRPRHIAPARPWAFIRSCLVASAATPIGLPIALSRLGGSPIPSQMPSWHAITSALTHRDNGILFIGGVRDLSWLAWAAFTIAVLAEVQATLRGRPAPRMRLLGLQGAAAKLVAVASVSFTTPSAVSLAATPALAAD